MSPFISFENFEKLKLIAMDIFFLFKNFNLNRCGISDYISSLSLELLKNKVNPIILTDKKINFKLLSNQSVRVGWNFFKIIKQFSSRKKSIFFLQYSPFNYSNTGFSFILIFLLLYLHFFKKEIKIVTNFHEIRNKFSVLPKYFLIYALHTIQFFIVYYLSKKIYYTNDSFVKNLRVLKNQKCSFVKIFSTIDFKNLKKKDQFVFFSSHFDFYKYKIFLTYIKNYQLSHNDYFETIFLGDANKKVKSKIALLIKDSNIKNYRIINFCTREALSKILSSNKAVFVTNKDDFKINSSFLVSAIVAKNSFFLLKKSHSCSLIRNKYFMVKNQSQFNKAMNLIIKSKQHLFVKKQQKLSNAYNPSFISKAYLVNFRALLKE